MIVELLLITVTDNIQMRLKQMVLAVDEDPLPLLRQLIAVLRPPRRHFEHEAPLRWRYMLESLIEHPEWCVSLRRAILKLFSTHRQVSFESVSTYTQQIRKED